MAPAALSLDGCDPELDQDENQAKRLGVADPSKTAIVLSLSSHFRGSNLLFFHHSSGQPNPKQDSK